MLVLITYDVKQGAEDCGKLPSNASIMASGFKILFLSVCLMLHNAAAFNIHCVK